MTLGKDGEDKDNPLHFSGEIKDWPTFKEAMQSRADARDATWLLEAGRGLALFFARQIKDKTGSGATRKKALERENVKTDSNHVPTSVDAYTVGALEEWFNDRDLATDLHLSLNKNHLASMGSNVCDHTRLKIQRCSGAGEGAQGRRPQVPLTDKQSGCADLSRCCF
jgi:hypothetical protein